MLLMSTEQFNLFFEKMMDGFAYHKIVVDEAGKPVNYIFLEVNKAFEEMTGLKKEKIVGKKVTEVLKGIESDPSDWIGVYGRVALTGVPVQLRVLLDQLAGGSGFLLTVPKKATSLLFLRM